MQRKNYNKREKIASTLFDVIKYILTVIVIGSIFNKFDYNYMLIGFCLSMGLGVIAYFITPEKED
ncbi:MAG: hypothetical protein ABH870_00995 [bacterium]